MKIWVVSACLCFLTFPTVLNQKGREHHLFLVKILLLFVSNHMCMSYSFLRKAQFMWWQYYIDNEIRLLLKSDLLISRNICRIEMMFSAAPMWFYDLGIRNALVKMLCWFHGTEEIFGIVSPYETWPNSFLRIYSNNYMVYLLMNNFIHCILKKNIMDIYLIINKVFILFVIIYWATYLG